MTSPPDAAPPGGREPRSGFAPPSAGSNPGPGSAPRPGDVPRPKPLPPVADVFVGLVSVALDVAACVPIVLGLGFQRMGDGSRSGPGGGPPPMDWGPTLAFGVIAVLIALSAIGFGVSGMPVSAFLQGAAAVVMVLVLAGVTSDEHHRSHPRPPATSTWEPYTGPVCYSGGDNCP